jgi:hypothetical protein
MMVGALAWERPLRRSVATARVSLMSNRLASESSPYLLQHADNPVDWYPWGAEALERAQREDKPVFVSIGYAACHWCHVMAHESFEDPEIAALMNELFVNVKVDREERPDVDSVYMNAIHVTGEGGGWPLSAFCDDKGRPFFLGTYFPPAKRYGRPGFPEVLRTMARVYREQRDQVDNNVRAVLDGLRQLDEHYRRGAAGRDPGDLDEGMLVAAGRSLAQRCDPHHGGFGSKPKFPSSSSHQLLGRVGRLKFGEPAKSAFLLQAEKMARGGIYDHLGGGFARYSVDERWLVPHFEKMLYDNAQLLAVYGDALALTGEAEYRQLIQETIGWLEREMSDPAGGLYASQDADSEGVEGKFYVWTPEQIREVLGAADAIVFNRVYGVREGGNFDEGTTVLSRVGERGSEAEEQALADMRRRLFEARARRVPPATDTKVLASWNGLAVSGLVRAWEASGFGPALALAERVAAFLVDRMLGGDGDRLSRVFKDGETRLDGTLEDYAFVAKGFIDLAFALEDRRYWDRARALLSAVLDRFYAETPDGVGVFYLTSEDAGDELVHRPESNQDGATPSGAAVAVESLVAVARLTGDARAAEISERYLAARAPQMVEHPYMGSRLLAALDLYLNGIELVITEGSGREELATAARRAFVPGLLWGGPWASSDLLAGKGPGSGGAARAFVCRGRSCSAPIESPEELAAALRRQ